MKGMNDSDYNLLINDTLTYLRGLLPTREEVAKMELPPLPQPPKPKPKPQFVAPSKESLPPPPEKPKETKTFIKLEPLPAPPHEPTEGTRKILKEIDPDLYIHESVPSDYKAKQIKEAWKEKQGTPAIPILFQGIEYRKFVQRIAKAIDTVYGSCHLVDITIGKKWDLFLESENLKLIIIPDIFLFGNKELLPFYQETPQQKKRKLGNIPLLLLPDLSLYYKDPYLKRSLWNVICNTIDSLPSS